MSKISVIIPVYNANKYLRKCLDSVCNQTLSNIEIICVNDCSTDESFAILKEYSKKDTRIKIINLIKNQGAAIARNKGISCATGQYIGFVDSDDFIDLDFYEKLFNTAIKTKADVCKGNLKSYDIENNIFRIEERYNLNHYIEKHKAYFTFTFTTAIFKTSIIKDNNIHFIEGLIHFEDPFFTIMAGLFYHTIVVVNDAYYYYVNNPNSATRKNITIKHTQAQVQGSKLILDLLEKYKVDKQHYIIVFNFVMLQLLDWCKMINKSDNFNIIASEGLNYILERCLYRKECLVDFFLFQKEQQRREIINQIKYKMKYTKEIK